MARIRTIKPELLRHEKLFDLEQSTGLPVILSFIGMLTVSDREGRFKWRPKTLKLDALPYHDADFSRVLDALETGGFIVRYEVDGEVYGCIPTFTKHQVINNKERDSELPPPPSLNQRAKKNTVNSMNCQRDDCASSTRETRDDDSYRKGNKEKEEESSTNVLLVASDADNPCRDKEILAEKPQEQVLKPDKPKPRLVPPPCPYQQIVDLYHEMLPMMPQVKKLTEKRRRQIKARWLESPKWQNLETWKIFFSRVSESRFLTGNSPPSYGRSVPFLADLEWLTRESNFVKVCEARYEDEQPRKYAS
jgi:hypothetical protein